jgi:hypothetical protein
LAYRPFSPWREGDELTLEDRLQIETRPPSKLDGIGWRGEAELYRVLLRVGIPPPVADEMELWQLGAVLGADEDRAEGVDAALWERERDSLPARAAAIREPEQDITAQVMAQMGITPG